MAPPSAPTTTGISGDGSADSSNDNTMQKLSKEEILFEKRVSGQ